MALNAWVKPIAYCEIDTHFQGVLLSRIADGIVGNAPIWDDIRSLSGKEFCNSIDIMYGGFPCQDVSVAGHGKGLGGERSGLFFEIVRLAQEIKPKFIFLENVPAITSRGGVQVVESFTEMGYDCRWCVISASAVGALHHRERWFLLAHPTSKECSRLRGRTEKAQPSVGSPGQYASINEWQEAVSSVCRTTDGIPQRTHRIKALGNAVVPQQAKEAFQMLMGLK